jgi:hypothetical protein
MKDFSLIGTQTVLPKDRIEGILNNGIVGKVIKKLRENSPVESLTVNHSFLFDSIKAAKAERYKQGYAVVLNFAFHYGI